MCTLIVLDRVVPGIPVVVASNRDEYLSRPAAPPAWVDPPEHGRPAYVAPQDLEGGGTWMGFNSTGVFVGLTNRASEHTRDDRRSRGLLVRDALARHCAEAIARDMRTGLEGTYNPFHLLSADGRGASLTVLRPDGADTQALGPGRHVVGNRDPDDPVSTKIQRVQRAVDAIDLERPFPHTFAALAAILRRHEVWDRPLENTCVHTPAYGTRSSAILAMGDRRWQYWQSDGFPCETKYTNYSRLAEDLRRRPPRPPSPEIGTSKPRGRTK